MKSQNVRHEDPALTTPAFARLLEWLDDGVDSDGETYLEMRRRLAAYFGRRTRPRAEDLADETLDRIARTLQKDGTIAITPPAKYCYTVARFVLLEDVRREHKHRRLDETSWSRHLKTTSARSIEPEESVEIQEQRLECLERRLQELPPVQHALVIEYYRDTRRQRIEHRREMAERLGITMNALCIRVSRIRARLEAAVERCRKQSHQDHLSSLGPIEGRSYERRTSAVRALSVGAAVFAQHTDPHGNRDAGYPGRGGSRRIHRFGAGQDAASTGPGAWTSREL